MQKLFSLHFSKNLKDSGAFERGVLAFARMQACSLPRRVFRGGFAMNGRGFDGHVRRGIPTCFWPHIMFAPQDVRRMSHFCKSRECALSRLDDPSVEPHLPVRGIPSAMSSATSRWRVCHAQVANYAERRANEAARYCP
jgi:hypothetical protein